MRRQSETLSILILKSDRKLSTKIVAFCRKDKQSFNTLAQSIPHSTLERKKEGSLH